MLSVMEDFHCLKLELLSWLYYYLSSVVEDLDCLKLELKYKEQTICLVLFLDSWDVGLLHSDCVAILLFTTRVFFS